MNNKVKHRAQATATTLPGDPPEYDKVAVLAYSYWEARGYQGGSAEEDWLRAEEELRKRHAQMRVPKVSRTAAKGMSA